MLKIYGYPKTRSSRVVWALEEAEAEYEYLLTAPGTEAKQPPYLKLNPGGKVPTLIDDDFILTESAAICTYIGDLYPASKLTPACGTRDRAAYNQWCFFAMTELEQPLWSMAKHRFALPKEYRLPAMMNTAAYEFNRALDVFHQRLGDRNYLVGDRFTCADLLIASILNWASMNSKEDHPLQYSTVEAYLQRMLERPAFSRAQARESGE